MDIMPKVLSRHLAAAVRTDSAMNLDVMMNIAGLSLLSVDDSCHHFGQPQIFLLVDEGDPFSRALVFRGLADIDYLNL
jgi:hypothetical protein